jgi:hypothetical protein
MKNLLFIAALVLIVSCNSNSADSSETEATPVERAIGFNTQLPDLKWHLGTEEAISIVKKLDEKWAVEDYEGVKGFFADTAVCYFPDGIVAKSSDEFIAKIKSEDDGSEVSWTFDYAFSVDLDPSLGGEHVQAGFTGTSTKDGVEEKKSYHESYYIIMGKIVMWRQYTIDILE